MDIMPGTLLVVQGPRRSWFRRERLPVQILAFEPASGIAHVSLLWEPPELDTLPVEIGFVPVLISVFEPSILEIVGPRPVGNDWWAALQEWKSRRFEGLATAFSLPLWEVRSLAWEVVHEYQPRANRENFYLEYAFPEAESKGLPFRKVRVMTLPRPGAPLPENI